MIEVFESKERHLIGCSQREQRAAEAAITNEARQIHQKLAEMYEHEATRTKR